MNYNVFNPSRSTLTGPSEVDLDAGVRAAARELPSTETVHVKDEEVVSNDDTMPDSILSLPLSKLSFEGGKQATDAVTSTTSPPIDTRAPPSSANETKRSRSKCTNLSPGTKAKIALVIGSAAAIGGFAIPLWESLHREKEISQANQAHPWMACGPGNATFNESHPDSQLACTVVQLGVPGIRDRTQVSFADPKNTDYVRGPIPGARRLNETDTDTPLESEFCSVIPPDACEKQKSATSADDKE